MVSALTGASLYLGSKFPGILCSAGRCRRRNIYCSAHRCLICSRGSVGQDGINSLNLTHCCLRKATFLYRYMMPFAYEIFSFMNFTTQCRCFQIPALSYVWAVSMPKAIRFQIHFEFFHANLLYMISRPLERCYCRIFNEVESRGGLLESNRLFEILAILRPGVVLLSFEEYVGCPPICMKYFFPFNKIQS